MSKKAMLQSLLGKVAGGDKTSVVKLCNIIAGIEIFIPTLNIDDAASGATKVSVMRVREGERRLVPIFTSEEGLKNWIEALGISASTINLLCSDLCLTLDNQTWLVIEGNAAGPIELEPKYVKLIANTELDFISEEDEELVDTEDDLDAVLSGNPQQPKPVPPQPIERKHIAPLPPQERAMGRTQVVQVVPRSIEELKKLSDELTAANAEPDPSQPVSGSGVRRFRDNDKDDARSTVDLTAVVRKARESGQ